MLRLLRISYGMNLGFAANSLGAGAGLVAFVFP